MRLRPFQSKDCSLKIETGPKDISKKIAIFELIKGISKEYNLLLPQTSCKNREKLKKNIENQT